MNSTTVTSLTVPPDGYETAVGCLCGAVRSACSSLGDVSIRATRAARGAAFAALASLSAATAHTLAGGGAPSPLFCVLLAVLALPLTTALAGTRPALWRTAAAMGAAQLLFHAAFATVGDIGRAGDATPADAFAAHHHGALMAAAPTPAGSAAAMAGGMDVPMIGAHALAAALSVLAVHRGERMLRAVTAWLPQVVRRIRIALAPPVRAPRIPRSIVASLVPVRLRLLGASVSRRGPPSPLVLP
jgi:hypothetical protein